MALIRCSECGREVSDHAKVCVHCGNPINQADQAPVSKAMIYGYTQSFVVNPPVKILVNGLEVGSVSKGGLFELPLARDTLITFKCSFRKAEVLVRAGQTTKIKLSWNRLTGQLVPQIVDTVVPDNSFW